MDNNTSIEQKNYIKSIKNHSHWVIFCQIAFLILFLLLWEFFSYIKWIDPFIFSSPSRILMCFIEMSQEGTLLYHYTITLVETLIGFFLGTIIGIILAIALWWNKTLYEILEPTLIILNSLPKTALAPILIVWVGNNMKAIIVTSILLSVIITIINVLNGFNKVEDIKINLIYSFGGKKLHVLTKLVIPSSIPTIISTIKVNIGLSLVGVIIGEFLVARSGLGYLIVYGSQIFRLDWVMLSLILLGITAAILYRLIHYFERKLSKHYLSN